MYLVSRYLKAKSYIATTRSILLLKSRWRVYVWTKTNNEESAIYIMFTIYSTIVNRL